MNSGPAGTQATVAGIWAEVLERDEIGPDDDFFALGGDSLLAVWLVEEIARRTGRELPLSLLLEGVTIRRLAAAIDAQAGGTVGAADRRGINVTGTRRPLFWIHGWAELLAMREHFHPDQPVFQIQEPLARRWRVKPPLEQSARAYVQQLRAIQRGGPYQLIGYSFGGVFAFEMAQQLIAAGEEVSFLGLLDTPAPGFRFPLAVRVAMQSANLVQLGRMLAGLRGRSWLNGASFIRHAIPAITRHRWLRAIIKRLPEAWAVPTPPGSVIRIRYVPRRYPGPVVLFWATGGWPRRVRTPDLGWTGLAGGGLSVRPVPGTHRTMAYGEHAGTLAREVTECLGA